MHVSEIERWALALKLTFSGVGSESEWWAPLPGTAHCSYKPVQGWYCLELLSVKYLRKSNGLVKICKYSKPC